ncbi:MAG: transcriptional repressor LexA [Alphaproteobacteria bacterium]|nr:transcriptional repressor LexA [Alphaproteobacteria bacterium]PHY00233.1 MAG: repressor LexA [Rhodospirillaceae bacterium]
MLTKKQYQLLLLIRDRMNRDGVAPSFDEMKDALQLKSKSGIHRLIGSLEERGFLRRLPHKARALEVLKLPDSASDRPASGFAPNIISGNFGISGATAKTSSPVETVELPLYGKIAAGTPIEALRNPLEHIGVPAGLLGTGEHYALTIDGDSMIDAGINDGDTVLIKRCDTAENGSIVVALVDNEEATLKRLRRKGESIALEPANKSYETRIFGPDRVKVQGKLVGLYRRY